VVHKPVHELWSDCAQSGNPPPEIRFLYRTAALPLEPARRKLVTAHIRAGAEASRNSGLGNGPAGNEVKAPGMAEPLTRKPLSPPVKRIEASVLRHRPKGRPARREGNDSDLAVS